MSVQGSITPFLLLLLTITVSCVKYSSRYKETEFTSTTTIRPNRTERIENYWPVRAFNCVGSAGLQKCLKIFLVKRLDRVEEAIASGNDVSVDFDVVDEIKNDFQWESYRSLSDGELDGRLIKSVSDVFLKKNTTLVLHPGIDIDIIPDENGSITLNLKKDPDLQLSRGMKFPKKAFYRIVPMLLIPPLIMSAILPFVLPAMKILILWTGMINQMALMGAIFTLMRNNAFQDSYEKKVIYVNDGYKNEKKPPRIKYHHETFHQPTFDKNPHHIHDPPQFPHFSAGDNEHFNEGFHKEESFGDSYHLSHIPVHNYEDDEYDRKGVSVKEDLRRGNYKIKGVPMTGI